MNLNVLMSEIRKRVDAEKDTPELRKSFSEALKKEVVAVARKCEVKSEAALQMGVSQSSLSRWMDQFADSPVAPRKLLVVNDPETIIEAQHKPDIALIEAILPNGVVLKNLPFTQASLFLLRGVQ